MRKYLLSVLCTAGIGMAAAPLPAKAGWTYMYPNNIAVGWVRVCKRAIDSQLGPFWAVNYQVQRKYTSVIAIWVSTVRMYDDGRPPKWVDQRYNDQWLYNVAGAAVLADRRTYLGYRDTVHGSVRYSWGGSQTVGSVPYISQIAYC